MLITFEGIEGSGKSTVIRYAAEYLKSKGHDCVITREPGATPIGRQIREILLNPDSKEIVSRAELLLYMADRVQHIETVIIPALSAGRIVLCDRFTDSTIAYQGYARGIRIDFIRQLHDLVLKSFKPDLTILLDLEPRIGLSRKAEDRVETRFEQEAISFHQKVRDGYLQLAKISPGRFRIIDASESVQAVESELATILDAELRKTSG
jgi:dTMP kinase